MSQNTLPTPEQTHALLTGRRTVHDFKADAVDTEALAQAIDAARWAPNHRFTEPWRVYTLGPETAEQVIDLSLELVTAKRGPEVAEKKRKKWQAVPQWLVVTQIKSDDSLQSQEDYASCCCAIQNMQLSLWAAGIGMKWTTGPVTRDHRLLDLLWANPEDEMVVGLLQCGYPAAIPSVPRKPVANFSMVLP